MYYMFSKFTIKDVLFVDNFLRFLPIGYIEYKRQYKGNVNNSLNFKVDNKRHSLSY